MDGLGVEIARRVTFTGPMRFDEFLDRALYDPRGGFYGSGGGAGRRRDFMTSPEVGPLFGAVVARALDTWWLELGRPDPFTVVEAGAGPGTLARTLLAARPACTEALRLVLVERAPVQWTTHPDGVESRGDLPAPGELGAGPLVVLANELLDNLPFRLVVRTPDDEGWAEVGVGWSSPERRLVEVSAPLDAETCAWCEAHAGVDAPVGGRLPLQHLATAWLQDALALAAGGRVVVVDYVSRTADLLRRPHEEWVRTYAGHGRAADPLADPGSCDITCEVDLNQLAAVRPPDLDRDQASWLRHHGIEALVAEGAARWRAEGSAGGLHAIAGRSRVHEAEALTDPSALGAFRVLEWTG